MHTSYGESQVIISWHQNRTGEVFFWVVHFEKKVCHEIKERKQS